MKELSSISWKALGRTFLHQVRKDRVFQGGAALAFYWMLALFPGMVFLLTLLPYLPIEELGPAIMELIGQALPAQAAELLTGTVQNVVTSRNSSLLSLSILGAIWSASTGMYGAMQQLNVACGVDEARSFFKARGLALLLTFLFGALVLMAFALIVTGGYLQSAIGNWLGWSDTLRIIFAGFRWIVIVGAIFAAFITAHHWAPNVEQRWRDVIPGAVVSTVGLLLASLGFRTYVENFGEYDAVYGSLGAVITLMLWLYGASLALILGAEINEVLESQRPGGKKRGEHQHLG